MPIFAPLALYVAAPPPYVSARARPDRNAFVDHRIRNLAQLMHEVRADPYVASRYERHFSMDRQGVLNYFSDLHRGTLARSGVYTIYSVPEDGHVKMHRGLLRKGEGMFFDRKGFPVLVLKCGNPLVLGPNQTLFRPTTPMPGTPEATRDVLDLREPEPLYAEELTPAEPDVPLALAPPSLPPVPPPGLLALDTVPASTLGGSPFPYLGLAPILFPIIRGGDGGFTPYPAPEPMALAPFAVGAALLVRRRRRR